MAQYSGDENQRPQPGSDAGNIFDPNNLAGNNLSLTQPVPTWQMPTYDLANGWTFPQVPSGSGGFGGGGGAVPIGGGAAAGPAPLPATAVPSVAAPVSSVAPSGALNTLGALPSTAVPSVAAPIASVGTSGAMPVASSASLPGWLKAIGGVPTLGNLAGAGIAAYTANKASNQQAAAAQAALDFAKQQWQTTQQNLSPYMSLGSGATNNLRFLAGIPNAPALAPAGTTFPQVGHVAPPGTPTQGMAVPRAGNAMVTIQAPTGERRQVPANQSSYYVSKGGRVI